MFKYPIAFKPIQQEWLATTWICAWMSYKSFKGCFIHSFPFFWVTTHLNKKDKYIFTSLSYDNMEKQHNLGKLYRYSHHWKTEYQNQDI